MQVHLADFAKHDKIVSKRSHVFHNSAIILTLSKQEFSQKSFGVIINPIRIGDEILYDECVNVIEILLRNHVKIDLWTF